MDSRYGTMFGTSNRYYLECDLFGSLFDEKINLRQFIGDQWSGNQDLHFVLFDNSITGEDVVDALHFAVKTKAWNSVAIITKHPCFELRLTARAPYKRQLWNSAVNDKTENVSEILNNHTFDEDELGEMLLEAGRQGSYRFLKVFVAHPKVPVEYHNSSEENILKIILKEYGKHEEIYRGDIKLFEETFQSLLILIGEEVKSAHCKHKKSLIPYKGQKMMDHVDSNEDFDEFMSKHRCLYSDIGKEQSLLHLAICTKNLSVFNFIMHFGSLFCHVPNREESMDLLSLACTLGCIPIICYILQHAIHFLHTSSRDFNFNKCIFNCEEFSDEENIEIIQSILAVVNAKNKVPSTFLKSIFKHGDEDCVGQMISKSTLIEFNDAQAQDLPVKQSIWLKYALEGKIENLAYLMTQRSKIDLDIDYRCICAKELRLPDGRFLYHPLRSLNIDDDERITALQVALLANQNSMLTVLLDHGVDTRQMKPFTFPTLCHINSHRNPVDLTCLKLLLRYGSDQDEDRLFPLINKEEVEVQVSLIDYFLICKDLFTTKLLWTLGCRKFDPNIDRSTFNVSSMLQYCFEYYTISDDHVEDFIANVIQGNICSLYMLSRRAVRAAIATNIPHKITQLHLPSTVKEYLNLPELDDIEEQYEQFRKEYIGQEIRSNSPLLFEYPDYSESSSCYDSDNSNVYYDYYTDYEHF